MNNNLRTLRILQISLGILWLLDGLLQLQPFMFTADFANSVIAPVAQGQPPFVAQPILWSVHIMLHAPAFFDSIFALIQIIIGFCFLWKKTVRPAILLSIFWGLGVWFFGEGLGGIASGVATQITGAPGTVLLYVILGIAAWPQGKWQRTWVPATWAIFWIGSAILTLLPAQRSAAAITSAIMNVGMSAPAWLMQLDMHINSAILAGGIYSVVILCVVQFCVGIGGLFTKTRTVVAYLGIILGLVFWVIGQAFGLLTSGSSTDPNSGPLIVLFAVSLLGIYYSASRDSNF